jgi:hypothetical protein
VSYDHIRAARDLDAKITRAARHVLLALATYTDGHGFAWPSSATLADATGYASVRRILADLVDAQILFANRRLGRPTVYSLAHLADPNDPGPVTQSGYGLTGVATPGVTPFEQPVTPGVTGPPGEAENDGQSQPRVTGGVPPGVTGVQPNWVTANEVPITNSELPRTPAREHAAGGDPGALLAERLEQLRRRHIHPNPDHNPGV